MTRTVSPPTRPFALQVGAILGGAQCRGTVPVLPPILGASQSLHKRLDLINSKIKHLLRNFKKASLKKKDCSVRMKKNKCFVQNFLLRKNLLEIV